MQGNLQKLRLHRLLQNRRQPEHRHLPVLHGQGINFRRVIQPEPQRGGPCVKAAQPFRVQTGQGFLQRTAQLQQQIDGGGEVPAKLNDLVPCQRQVGVQPVKIFPQKGLMLLFKATHPKLKQRLFPQMRGACGFFGLLSGSAFPARLFLFQLSCSLRSLFFVFPPGFCLGLPLIFHRLGYFLGLLTGRVFSFFLHRPKKPPDVDWPAKVACGQLLLYRPPPFDATGVTPRPLWTCGAHPG